MVYLIWFYRLSGQRGYGYEYEIPVVLVLSDDISNCPLQFVADDGLPAEQVSPIRFWCVFGEEYWHPLGVAVVLGDLVGAGYGRVLALVTIYPLDYLAAGRPPNRFRGRQGWLLCLRWRTPSWHLAS